MTSSGRSIGGKVYRVLHSKRNLNSICQLAVTLSMPVVRRERVKSGGTTQEFWSVARCEEESCAIPQVAVMDHGDCAPGLKYRP